jgi:cell division protein FtsL
VRPAAPSRRRIENHDTSAPLALVRRRSRSLIRRGAGTRLAPLAALAGVCVAALLFGVLLEQVILAQSAFKLARVRRQMTAAEVRNEELTLEVTKLASPTRIERHARRVLGMVAPSDVEYVVAAVRAREPRIARRQVPDGRSELGAAAGAAE